jgi:hypothetical protein
MDDGFQVEHEAVPGEDAEYLGDLDDEEESVGEASQCTSFEASKASALLRPPCPTRTLASSSAAGKHVEELEEELEAVILGTGNLFERQGWNLMHAGGDRYRLGGRTIKLTLLSRSASPPATAHLVASLSLGPNAAAILERAARIAVLDGSLQQPLFDYLLQTGKNEQYDQRGTENPAGVSGAAKNLEFNIAPTGDRILEMRNALLQAEVRRRAQGGEPTRMSALQGEGGKLLGSVRPPSGGSVALQRPSAAPAACGPWGRLDAAQPARGMPFVGPGGNVASAFGA